MRVTKSVHEIKSVLRHSDIWPNIADGENAAEFVPPLDGYVYLYEPGGLFILHDESKGTQIHANVIKWKRGDSERMAREALDYAFGEHGSEVVFAEIPDAYKNVAEFAGKFMSYEGEVNGIHHYTIEADQWAS